MSVKELYDGTLEVMLTGDEVEIATLVGKARNRRAEALGRDPNYSGLNERIEDGMPQDLLHIHGHGGEIAGGKALGIYVSSQGQLYEQDDDIGGIAARCRTQHWMDLYLKPDDNPNPPWLLITGTLPGPYVLRGWIWGRDATNLKFFQTANNTFPLIDSFIIPQHHLSQDWDTLIEWANDHRKYNISSRSVGVSTQLDGMAVVSTGNGDSRILDYK